MSLVDRNTLPGLHADEFIAKRTSAVSAVHIMVFQSVLEGYNLETLFELYVLPF